MCCNLIVGEHMYVYKKHRNIISQKSTCDKCNRKSEQVNLSQFEDVHT